MIRRLVSVLIQQGHKVKTEIYNVIPEGLFESTTNLEKNHMIFRKMDPLLRQKRKKIDQNPKWHFPPQSVNGLPPY